MNLATELTKGRTVGGLLKGTINNDGDLLGGSNVIANAG
jgi:hypothetical protein